MGAKDRVRRALEHVPGVSATVRLVLETVRVCLRYRVTGLAAEGGFFMLLSLPPLVLGLFGGAGFVGSRLGADTVAQLVEAVHTYASRFLTEETIEQLLLPTIDDVLRTGRADLVSVGFLFAIWSGSRALNVFIDTISIMYGQGSSRSIVGMRLFSLTLYTAAVIAAVVVLPLVLLGPGPLQQWLPEQVRFLANLYWPVVLLLSIASLATLYHLATPRRARWWRSLPGALLAFVIWALASYVVRVVLAASLGGSSIYGPLSTPIVLLTWLYFLAIGILIGAGLNAATQQLWPAALRDSAGRRLWRWARTSAPRRRPGPAADAPAPTSPGPSGPGDAASASGVATSGGGADEQGRRQRDQQYERSERSAFAEAIDRELSRELHRGPHDATSVDSQDDPRR